MLRWLKALREGRDTQRRELPEPLWKQTLEDFPFLARRDQASLRRLRQLTRQFLDQKEFHGAGGLQINDRIAVAIAAQACLPIVHIGAPYHGLDWYADFVGIVVHPGAVLARRETTDENGVVHRYAEELTGEAMQDGPITLSWQDVADAGRLAQEGINVVIHEFAHKLDMRDGATDGCPPLVAGFSGQRTAAAARKLWLATLRAQYERFCDQLSVAERFGGKAPWLDPYAAHSIDEFFAVATEAYFVNPETFARDFPALLPMFDAFFNPSGPTN